MEVQRQRIERRAHGRIETDDVDAEVKRLDRSVRSACERSDPVGDGSADRAPFLRRARQSPDFPTGANRWE